MPAEWYPRAATLMAWPVRTEAWLDGLDQARDGFTEVAAAIAEFEPLVMVARGEADASGYTAAADARRRLGRNTEIWELPQDDSWIRDNGPTFLVDDRGRRAGVNWRFNAWGRKYDPFDADDALAARILDRLGLRRFDAPLVLEGGSIHVDGQGTLLTTAQCLLAANRNPELSQEKIESFLRDYLTVDTVVWLDRGLSGDETDGHVDNVACFVQPGLVALQVAADADSANHAAMARNAAILAAATDAQGRRLRVVGIPEPPVRACGGETLALSYINFYPVSGGLVVPVFGRDGSADLRRADDRALGILAELYPGRKIVAIDGMKIIKGGGNVHCITQQIPAEGITGASE